MSSSAPSWKRDLEEHGFAIVRGVVTPERASEYVAAAHTWAGQFGWSAEDRSTWNTAHLPAGAAGVVSNYGTAHEKWVWEARMEPKIAEAFAEVWGTDELIVSFDVVNFSVPVGPHARTDIVPTPPWPHCDQQPRPSNRPHFEFELAQGLLALSPSGPTDGGLVVLKGSHKLVKRYLDDHDGYKPGQDWGESNYYTFTEADIEWFHKQPGCTEIKVETEAGDLVLWDSRTIHWNRVPTGDIVRNAVYVCMCPKSMASAELLDKRKEYFEKRLATSHWPAPYLVGTREAFGADLRDGKEDHLDHPRPLEEPVVTKRMLQLVGCEPY
ncbi:phytanoyl-CoA dioxygenase family protein [Rhodotorula paludigena]|uniref:phytanoyl-CoA dioxygenase family protein n=1 Tax=Rhodotorula paludigena TaxID=86838 RepID=UPI003170C16A